MKKGFQRQLNLDFYLRSHGMTYRENRTILVIYCCHLDFIILWRDVLEIKYDRVEFDCLQGIRNLSFIRVCRCSEGAGESDVYSEGVPSRDIASFPKFQTAAHTAWQQNTVFSIRTVQEGGSARSPCSQTVPPSLTEIAQRKPNGRLWRAPWGGGSAVALSPPHPPATGLDGARRDPLVWMPVTGAHGRWPVPRRRRACKWHHPQSPADSQGKMSHGGDLYPSEEVGPMTSKGFQIKRCGNSSSLPVVNIIRAISQKKKTQSFKLRQESYPPCPTPASSAPSSLSTRF